MVSVEDQVRETILRLLSVFDEGEDDNEDVARIVLDSISPRHLRKVALMGLRLLVDHMQRDLVRQREERATRHRQAEIEARNNTPAAKAARKAQEEQYRREDAKRRQDFADEITAITENYRNYIRLELTKELLASGFALGDGRRVTWGGATVADHRDRISLLEGHAVGTLESAARHYEAIRLLESLKVDTLNDVQRVPVPT